LSSHDETDEQEKAVTEMREICYCGRRGEAKGREPIGDSGGERPLRCPNCGHLDYLVWLPEDVRTLVLDEAERRTIRRKASTTA
jgi:hypothetical protein